MVDSIEDLLDEGTRDAWDDSRAQDYLADIDALLDDNDPGLRRSIQALMSHSASPIDSLDAPLARPSAAERGEWSGPLRDPPPRSDPLADPSESGLAFGSAPASFSDCAPDAASEADPAPESAPDTEDPTSESAPTEDRVSHASDVSSDPVSDASDFSSDPVSDASDFSSDPVSDASSASDASSHERRASSALGFSPQPPTPFRVAALARTRALKRHHAADDERSGAARRLFVDDVAGPTFFVFQLGSQTGIFDTVSPPTDFFLGRRAETRTSLEQLLLSRLLFYTASRNGAAWSAFNADDSVYADADLMSWFLAPSYPLMLLCAVHAAFLGSVAADSPLENTARGALLRALLARIQLLRILRDTYRRLFGLQPPAVRAHLLGQPCRFPAAARIADGYHRLVCTAEDCVIYDYRCRFLARHPSGLLPNADQLCAAKKTPHAFPAVGNLPFCFDDLERHWRRDLPPLERDLFRDTLAGRLTHGARYPVGPAVFFSSEHHAFFATLPPSQSAHGSEIVGAIRLPFESLGATGPRARCGRLDPDAEATLSALCESERVARAPLLTSQASYPACRAAGITSPLVAPAQRVRWGVATRALLKTQDALVRDLYPLPQDTFDAFMSATSRAPAAKRRRATPPEPAH